jgi:putative hemolysin
MEIEIVIGILLLLSMTFFSTVEMAFGRVSDLGFRLLVAGEQAQPQSRPTAFLREIIENRPRFRFTLAAMIQVSLIAFSVLSTAIAFQIFQRAVWWMILALTLALVLAGTFKQLIPLLLTRRNPETLLLALLPVVQPVYRLMVVVADPFAPYFRADEKDATEVANIDETDDSASDIRALTEVGKDEGIIEEEERELIHSIIEFGDTRVNEVMTPRTDISALPIDATVREARDVVNESKYSRLPVFRDQIDNVEGLIYVRDLLQCWAEGKEAECIEPLVRPVFFVPETKPVADLLKEMQKAHQQLAMVIDEYGGIAGLVTVEDILEEIVGEIEDEDIEQEEIVEIVEGDEGYYEVSGSTEIGKVERLFDLEIEADDFTTVAGLVISEVGHVPRAGEHLTFRGLDVEVLRADDKRVNLVRLRRIAVTADDVDE